MLISKVFRYEVILDMKIFSDEQYEENTVVKL